MRRAASSETKREASAPAKATLLPQAIGKALDGLAESKPEKATRVYGRLANPGIVQLNITVKESVKNRLIEVAKSKNLKISEAADEILSVALGVSDSK